jgi:septal ring-binding cell division protein DamX
LEQVSLEYRARFQSYTTLPFPFTDNEKFFKAARSQNSVQATEAAAPSKSYGVNGIWNPDLAAGYTIIVHSLTSEADADRIAEDLQNSGLRTTVLNVVVNGRNYYRVAIGQFTTRNDASSAANQLPSPLNSSFFLAQLPEQ